MFALLTGLAALVATGTATIPPPPSLDEGMEEAEVLALRKDPYARFTVPVRIDGEGPFRFMIDTGAQATVLSYELANLLALSDRGTAVLVGMASRRPIETVPVDGVELGSRFFNIARAPLVPRENIGAADGILGIDSLQDQRVLIDFRKNQIAVADAAELGGNAGYEIVVRARKELGQLIITQARIDGVRVAVLVDTGAQGSIGNFALLKKLRSREHSTTELTDINGVQLNGTIRITRELQIGRAQLNLLPVFFAESPTFRALGLDDQPALVLGMNELKLFNRVAIDFKTRRVLFDLPNNARQTMRPNRFS
jgi:predicted aspartyl protease